MIANNVPAHLADARPVQGADVAVVKDDGTIWQPHGRGGNAWREVRRRGGRHQAPYVRLRANGTTRSFTVARVVLAAWIGPPDDPGSRWIAENWPDPCPQNCEATNLRWSSHAKRVALALVGQTVGRPFPVGEDHPKSRLSGTVVARIRRLYAAGATGEECAAVAGVATGTALAAISGKTWPNVSEPPSKIRPRGRKRKRTC